jgi:hypothetical protein
MIAKRPTSRTHNDVPTTTVITVLINGKLDTRTIKRQEQNSQNELAEQENARSPAWPEVIRTVPRERMGNTATVTTGRIWDTETTRKWNDGQHHHRSHKERGNVRYFPHPDEGMGHRIPNQCAPLLTPTDLSRLSFANRGRVPQDSSDDAMPKTWDGHNSERQIVQPTDTAKIWKGMVQFQNCKLRFTPAASSTEPVGSDPRKFCFNLTEEQIDTRRFPSVASSPPTDSPITAGTTPAPITGESAIPQFGKASTF